jgi:hypothetical protein
MNIDLAMNTDLAGTRIPDSKLAREIMELVRDTESPLRWAGRDSFWGPPGWSAIRSSRAV